MFYYSYFNGQGRSVLAAALQAEDPFKLAPYEIVDRVLANGELPLADTRKADLWRDRGEVYEVRLAKQNFLVAISRRTEEINVQEIRADAYDRTDYRESHRRRHGSEEVHSVRSGLRSRRTPVDAASSLTRKYVPVRPWPAIQSPRNGTWQAPLASTIKGRPQALFSGTFEERAERLLGRETASFLMSLRNRDTTSEVMIVVSGCSGPHRATAQAATAPTDSLKP